MGFPLPPTPPPGVTLCDHLQRVCLQNADCRLHGSVDWLQSQNKVMLWLTVSWPVCLGVKHLPEAQDHIFVTVRELWVCWCGVTFLTSGCVCHLHLLLALGSAVILRSESYWTHDHIYCLRFGTPSAWRARSPYLNPPVSGWPSYTPRHWVPFSWTPMTRRAIVEVFELASMQGLWLACVLILQI
jgi:hypothetical protein